LPASGSPGRGASVRAADSEQLDSIAVRVGDLDADEAMIVLPFGLSRARLLQPLARASDRVGVLELEAEVVGAGQPVRHRALAQREERAVGRPEDQEVLVVVHPFGKPEVLAVEGRGHLPIADRQRDVVQRHSSMIAVRRARSRASPRDLARAKTKAGASSSTR
jgi:hypothetical protein